MNIPDITKINVATDRLLEVTTNPRHRYILMSYARHRALEFSGQYEDVVAEDMMNPHPVYTMRALGVNMLIDGKDEVRALYRNWAETNQCVFYIEDEQVAVADSFVASRLVVYQQIWGGTLAGTKVLGHLAEGAVRELFIEMLKLRKIPLEADWMYLYRERRAVVLAVRRPWAAAGGRRLRDRSIGGRDSKARAVRGADRRARVGAAHADHQAFAGFRRVRARQETELPYIDTPSVNRVAREF